MYKLLNLFKQRNIKVSVDNGQLKTLAAPGAIDADLAKEIRNNKFELIEFLQQNQLNNEQAEIFNISKAPSLQHYPLSFAQQRIWFIDQTEGQSAHYNMPSVIPFPGAINIMAFQKALNTIVKRHEILRTNYFEVDGKAVQKVKDVENVEFKKIDLHSDHNFDQDIKRLATEEANKPFNLAKDLMIRCTLINFNQEQTVLLFTVHHIASDGWSINIIEDEFSQLYLNHAHKLPELLLQYKDYSYWQRQSLDKEKIKKALDYWQNRLLNIDQCHNLPLDKPRSKSLNRTAGVVNKRIDGELAKQLKNIAKLCNASMFITLQTAFAILIARWSHRSDVCIGSPISGRNHKDIEPLIGFFVNSIVLRCQLPNSQTFKQIVKNNREDYLTDFNYQDVPFDMLVDRIKPQRSLNITPLFQIFFAYQSENKNVSIENNPNQLSMDFNFAKFDLELGVEETSDYFDFKWIYSQSLFSQSTIERLSESLEILLKGITENPDLCWLNYPILPKFDIEKLNQINAKIDIKPHQNIIDLFEQMVELHPSDIAVVYEDQELTYKELNHKVNQVAHDLLQRSLPDNPIIGLYIERSVEMIIAIFGILKAGSAYIPLDPNYPVARLKSMIEDADIDLLLCRDGIHPFVEQNLTQICTLDSLIQQQKFDNPNLKIKATDLAYVIYTSGSTGKPKGIAIEHQHIAASTIARHHYYKEPVLKILTLSSMSFDASLIGFFWALTKGAQLHIMSTSDSKEIDLIYKMVNDKSISHLLIPPALYKPLLQNIGNKGINSDLKLVISGGESMDVELLDLHNQSPWSNQADFYNEYGPTEASVWSTVFKMNLENDNERIPIGASPGHAELYVFNEALEESPVGVEGELYIGGLGVARGYLNRPELTKQKFVYHPKYSSKRLYRTGDLVKLLKNGQFEFLGRTDDQVKIRGFRIELEEIANELRQQALIKNAIVTTSQHNDTLKIVAYIVILGEEESFNKVYCKQQLKKKLPDYMVPNAIMIVDTFPITVNDKIDIQSLPQPQFEEYGQYIPPSTDNEKVLVNIWQDLLNKKIIGVHDNFFEIGGDSILSIQAISRANQQGLFLTTKQLFDNQTIAELALVVGTENIKKISQEKISGKSILMPIQQRFLSELTELHHFNQSILLTPPKGFNLSNAKEILFNLYQKHDALRLTVQTINGLKEAEYIEWDKTAQKASLIVENIGDENHTEFIERKCRHWQQQFKLQNGPLFKMIVFIDGLNCHRLFLLAHHFIVDAVSWRILLTDMELAFNALANKQVITLSDKTSSLHSWAHTLHEYAQSDELLSQLPYWKSICKQHITALPKDKDNPVSVKISTTKVIHFELSKSETQQLLEHSNKPYNTNTQELLLASIYLAFQQWHEGNGLGIYLENHGRQPSVGEADLTETVGWFTNIYPLKIQSPSSDISTVIKVVKEKLRSVPDDGLGYGVLRYMAGVKDLDIDLEHLQLEFNYLGQFDQSINQTSTFKLATENTGDSISPDGLRHTLLGITCLVSHGKMMFNLDYSHQHYHDKTMQNLSELLLERIRLLLKHCIEVKSINFTPSDFPLVKIKQQEIDSISNVCIDLKNIYPATPMQQGMIFHSEIEASSYTVQTYPLLSGKLDQELLKLAWQQVIKRYDIFRTAFIWNDEDLLQVVSNAAEIPWYFEDISSFEIKKQDKYFSDWLEKDRNQGFDFNTPPLMRVSLFKLAENSYRMLWSHHHSLTDGWCLPIVYSEVMQYYQAFISNKNIDLPAVVPFEKYISWLQSQSRPLAEEFWFNKLKGISEATPLMIGKSTVDTIGYQTKGIKLSIEKTKELLNFAQSNQVTINVVFQLAWAYLLHRYSGQKKVVFGATISGRPANIKGIEDMVGLFINTIPVVVEIQKDQKIISQIKQLHQDFQMASEYGYLSLLDIQSQSAVVNGQNLFNTLVVFENYPAGETIKESQVMDELKVIDFESDESTDYALTVSVSCNEILDIRIGYDQSEFEEVRIERLLSHLENILMQLPFSYDFNQPIQMLTQNELNKLDYWQNQILEPSDESLADLINDSLLNNSEKIAVISYQNRISYGELEQKSSCLAREIKSKGIGTDDTVGLCMGRSIDLIIAMIAIIKSGATYVPLDPDLPSKRLLFIIDDADIKLTITHTNYQDLFEVKGENLMLIDQLNWFDGKIEKNFKPLTPILKDSAAYIIYSSGSTGQPKGIVVEHGHVVSATRSRLAYYKQSIESVLPLSSISFDASFIGILWSLISGAELNLLDSSDSIDVAAIYNCVNKYSISHLIIPPALYKSLLDFVESERTSVISQLRVVVCGGETPNSDLYQLHNNCSWNNDAKLYNEYGPSEATIWSTVAEMNDGKLQNEKIIGTSPGHAKTYVLDAEFNQLAIGIVGELYISGHSVARGYLNNPELTKEKFLNNPFSKNTQDKMYRTGDLAYFLENGNLVFSGRIDDQVKIRGARIELAEIEHCLLSCERVDSCLVLVNSEQSSNKYLTAYIHKKNQAFDDETFITEIRDTLQTKLPTYMLPSAYVIVSQWPLTPNGKIDKKALPEADVFAFQTEYTAATSSMEKSLVEIWATLLKIDADHISINANFFELGGNSLLAVRLSTKIKAQLGLELTVKVIFESPDIKTLARHLETCKTVIDQNEILIIDRNKSDLMLSFAQQRLWFIDSIESGSAQYNMPISLKIEGNFNLEAAEQAITRIIERHEPLRTVFADSDNGPIQLIKTNFDFKLVRHDLRNFNKTEKQQRIDDLIKQNCLSLFDLKKDLMVRTSYIDISEKDKNTTGLLLFSMHHIASDGWSMGILIQEFVQQYKAILKNEANPFQPLSIQYADYAYWQRQKLQGSFLKEQLDYWKNQLMDIPPVHSLPLDYPRPLAKRHEGKHVQGIIPEALSNELKAYAQRHNVTMYMLLHAALTLVLSKHSNCDDIVIGASMANRMQAELEPLIGFFINTLVLRTTIDHDLFSEYLSYVKQVNLEAQVNQDIPFEHLVEQCQVPRNIQHSPLFQIMFSMDNNEQSQLSLPDLNITAIDGGIQTTKFDLDISAQLTEHEIHISWIYDKSLFKQDRINQLNDHFCRLLSLLVEKQELPLAGLSLLSSQEQSFLINDINNSEVAHPQNQLMHELFENQVLKTPDHIAIKYKDQQLSYVSLNKSANQLAHYLREQGVTIEALVGICMDRSINMVIAILAILKSGGGYVPLDPNHPQARLKYIIKDTNMKHILSHKGLAKGLVTSNNIKLIELDVEINEQSIHRQCSDNLKKLEKQNAKNLAYVIYTSGSTGNPKGVLVEHGNLCNFLNFTQHAFMLPEIEGAVVSSTLAFDATVGSLFPPLCCGCYIELLPDDEGLLGYLKTCLLDQNRSLLFKITPAHLEAIANSDEYLNNAKSQHLLVVAGEQLLAKNISKWCQEILPSSLFINEYGPTEATVGSTIFENINNLELSQIDAIPIGRPLDNVKLFILDDHQQLLPFGTPGELYIGGLGVARGYLNRPDLNEEKFIKNPFDKNKGRLYRTGDLVQYLEDGNIQFIGRVDDQIKIRGFRIELGEIQHFISNLNQVKSCVITTNEDESGRQRIIAYLELNESAHIEKSQSLSIIRKELETGLPDYMMPSAFKIIDHWPLNNNGKVDKKSLLAMNISENDSDYQAPVTDTEYDIVKIWSKLLKIEPDKINVNSSFFEVGGHSLMMLEMISALIKKGYHINLKDIYEHKTVKSMAKLLDKAQDCDLPLDLKSTDELVIKLSDKPSLPIIFMIHPAFGRVDCYQELAEQLQPNINLYAIQAPWCINLDFPFLDLRELASLYVDAIVKSQASGPYKIGGWSAGGWIAYLVVEELLERNLTVDYFFILDSLIENKACNSQSKKEALNDLVSSYLYEIGESEEVLKKFAEWSEAQEYSTSKELVNNYSQFINNNLTNIGYFSEQLTALVLDYGTNLNQAIRQFNPITTELNSRLFLAKENPQIQQYIDVWKEKTRSLGLIEMIDGDHYTLIRNKSLKQLCKIVKKDLLIDQSMSD